MPDPIGPAQISLATLNAPAGPKTTTTPNDQMGADTFLKLLVAQLKYQDPTSPADSTQFLAQTAQFTMVEKLTELTEHSTEELTINRNLGAASLVGRAVQWTDDTGATKTGLVSAARLGSKGPILVVDGVDVPFTSVAVVV